VIKIITTKKLATMVEYAFFLGTIAHKWQSVKDAQEETQGE